MLFVLPWYVNLYSLSGGANAILPPQKTIGDLTPAAQTLFLHLWNSGISNGIDN